MLTDEESKELKQLGADLKEAIPHLVNFKSIMDELTAGQKTAAEAQAQIKEDIDKLNASVLGNAKSIVEIGKRKIMVKDSGLDDDEKIGFAKFFSGVFKAAQDPTNKELRDNIIELQREFPVAPTMVGTKSMTEGTDADGGYLVPEAFSKVIWRVAEQASVALKDCLITPLTPGYKMPLMSLLSSVIVTWVNEAGASQESNPTFAKTLTSAKKMMAHSIFSNELLEDEEVGLVNLVVELFGEAMAVEIDAQVFDGDGTVFTGVLQAVGVNTVTMAGTAFSSIDFDDMSDALSKLKASVRKGAKFYMERTIQNYFRKIKDDNGNPIWGPAANGSPPTIWGIPVEEVEAMPGSTDSALDTAFVIYGNMKNYQVGTRGAMSVKLASELLILNDQTVLVVRRRLAAKIALPAAFVVIKTAVSS